MSRGRLNSSGARGRLAGDLSHGGHFGRGGWQGGGGRGLGSFDVGWGGVGWDRAAVGLCEGHSDGGRLCLC